MRGRRRIAAFLIEPFKQIRFGLHVIALTLVFVGVLWSLFYSAFYEQYQHVVEVFQVVDVDALVRNDVFERNTWKVGFALVSFLAVMVGVVAWRTHRMYGPIVSMLRFLEEMRRGNYAVRISVREKDDFQNVVRALNEMAKALHQRHGVKLGVVGKRSSLDNVTQRVEDYEAGIVTVENANDDIEKAS